MLGIVNTSNIIISNKLFYRGYIGYNILLHIYINRSTDRKPSLLINLANLLFYRAMLILIISTRLNKVIDNLHVHTRAGQLPHLPYI